MATRSQKRKAAETVWRLIMRIEATQHTKSIFDVRNESDVMGRFNAAKDELADLHRQLEAA